MNWDVLKAKLKANKKVYVKNIGWFEIKPRRQGKIYGTYSKNAQPRYMERVTFTPHTKLKDFINDM